MPLLSFLLIPQQIFILGLDNLKALNFDYKMSLQCNTSSIPDEINLLISKLGLTSRGIKMSPVSFQISGQSMFCKSRSIALCLQEAVKTQYQRFSTTPDTYTSGIKQMGNSNRHTAEIEWSSQSLWRLSDHY